MTPKPFPKPEYPKDLEPLVERAQAGVPGAVAIAVRALLAHDHAIRNSQLARLLGVSNGRIHQLRKVVAG